MEVIGFNSDAGDGKGGAAGGHDFMGMVGRGRAKRWKPISREPNASLLTVNRKARHKTNISALGIITRMLMGILLLPAGPAFEQ